MFDALSTPVETRAVTLDAIRRITGLDWDQVDLTAPQIPYAPGVYLWVDAAAPHALRYHGSGTGKGCLHDRLSKQLAWRTNQRRRLAADPNSLTEEDAYELSAEVPAVHQAAGNRELFCAIAQPARWSIERSQIDPPNTALEWEAFISAVSLHVADHRGLVGGGAWESKAGTLGHLMTDLAWDRLVDVNGGTWL